MLRSYRSLVVAIVLAVSILPSAQAAGRTHRRPDPEGERVNGRGRIDWEKGVLYATGHGAVSNKEPNQAKAYLRARTYAKLDALRNLLMVVDHVKIDAHTTASDFESASDEIRAEVKGIVRGAQVIGERKILVGRDSIVEVTVATPMYGDQGIASVFVPEIARRQRADRDRPRDDAAPSDIPPAPAPEPENTPAPLPRRAAPPPPPVRSAPDDLLQRDGESRVPDLARGRFTSVIIDTRGLGVERCMSPKIRRADGSEVWGTLSVNLDWLIENGMVVYAHTTEQARRHVRAGDRPLILRAVGRAGGKFNSDPVLSDEDADRLLEVNRRSGMLDHFKVIFIVDAGN